jgi:hypothetical protein
MAVLLRNTGQFASAAGGIGAFCERCRLVCAAVHPQPHTRSVKALITPEEPA